MVSSFKSEYESDAKWNLLTAFMGLCIIFISKRIKPKFVP